MSIDCGRGAVLAIIPLAGASPFGTAIDDDSTLQDFAAIDTDVDLPSGFFDRLRQRSLPLPDRLVVNVPEDRPTAGALGGGALPKPAAVARVRELRIVTVDHPEPGSPELLCSEFLVAELEPERTDESCLVDTAKALSSSRGAQALVELVTRERLHDDTRATVLLAAYADGAPGDRRSLAVHLATRAPMGEELWRTDHTGVTELSERHVRFVTPRISGFVADAGGSSNYFEHKFVPELRMQYTLAVVLTLWQRIWMDELLTGVQAVWLTADARRRRLLRSKVSHERLERLRQLRNQHAVLIASGTFGPAFESGSQLQFWEELQRVHGIVSRRQELDEALSALAEAAEIEASVNLERLLAFFTLVVGIPSLVFAVLGVNISRVTSDTGVSFVLVLLLVAACLMLGAVVYLLASGRGASPRLVRRSIRTRE